MSLQEGDSETEAQNDCGPSSKSGFGEYVQFSASVESIDQSKGNLNIRTFSYTPSGIVPETDTFAQRPIVMLQSFQSKIDNSVVTEVSSEPHPLKGINDESSEGVYCTKLHELQTEDGQDEDMQRAYSLPRELKGNCEKYNGPVSDNALVLPYQDDTHYVQNIAKIPTNYTLNVEPNIGNLTALHNVVQAVTSSSQTLWLPTILTSDAINSDSSFDAESVTQSGISQIILTNAGDNYITQNANNQLISTGKLRHNVASAELVSHPQKGQSKVQILSNIALSKHTTLSAYTPQGLISSCAKESSSHVYSSQPSVYKATNISTKHNINPSVLNINNKVQTSQLIQNSLSGSHFTNPLSKNANISNSSVNLPMKCSPDSYTAKSYGKINAGTPSVTSLTTVNSHVLSRMVPGPKLSSSQSKYKSINAFGLSQKSNKSSVSQSATYGHPHKPQTSVPIKIIQQTNVQSPPKQSFKNWPLSRTTVHPVKNPSYAMPNTLNSKNTPIITSHVNQIVAQKLCSSLHTKNPQGSINVEMIPNIDNQKILSHTVDNSQAVHQSKASHLSLVLNQPSVRYAHTFVGENQTAATSQNLNHVSANQHLTAQILQSLSQSKTPLTVSTQMPTTYPGKQLPNDTVTVAKLSVQKRHIHGDPTHNLAADDIIGTEERPNLLQEIFPSTHLYNLQLVILDHTYAICPQAISSMTTISSAVGVTNVTPLVTSATTNLSLNTAKVHSPPVIVSGQSSLEHQTRSSPTSVTLQSPNLTVTQSSILYRPICTTTTAEDDDAGSVISSTDGEQRVRADSDTETAPEGEEEGKTRCVCDFTHDDGYMICCDRCSEWQHVDCMGIDRQNIPDDYMCDRCQPRVIDRRRAKAIQLRKQEELKALTAPSDSDSPSGTSHSLGTRRRRLLTVTTYTNTSRTNRQTPHSSSAAAPAPQPTKRAAKRPRRTDIIRKGIKRKLTEKRPKKKRDLIPHRNKYSALLPTSNDHNQWNDSYEQAMTNHYSPELRAKLNRYGNKLISNNQISSAITAHYCTTVPHAGGKILIATKDLKESTPIIELRGKYMLSAQQRLQPQPAGRAGSQRPGPFLFFYRLPRDTTQVCIDTRTYGNEARFVRRSCKPNAELQHCIIKGTLHVYLTTISSVQSNTEITILHDSSNVKQACACGNPKYCKVNGLNAPFAYKQVASEPTLREKRHSRRTSAVSPASPPVNLVPKETIPVILDTKIDKKRVIKSEIEPEEIAKEQVIVKHLSPDTTSQEVELSPIKSLECLETFDGDVAKLERTLSDDVFIETVEKPNILEIKEEVIKSRENTPERKLALLLSDSEPILKVKEEKPECKVKEEKTSVTGMVRRSSVQATRANRMSVTTSQESADEKSDESFDAKHTKSNQTAKDKKKLTREERKMEAIMRAIERMEKEELRKQEVKDRQSKRRESDTQQSVHAAISDTKDNYDQDDDNQPSVLKRRRKRKGRTRTVSCTQSNISRNRLNSADSDLVTSGDEGASLISPVLPPTEVSSSSHTNFKITSHEEDSLFGSAVYSSNIPDTDVGLSSACLLVEAAVGPLESAFKLPKTKKSIVSEWLGKSPERMSYTDIGASPTYVTSNDNNNGSPLLPMDKRPLSLESLVHVAATMIGDLSGGAICSDSSPEKNCSNDSTKLEPLLKNVMKRSPILLSPVKSPPNAQVLAAEVDDLEESPQRIVPKRSPRNILRDLPQTSPDKGKLPKKYRKNMKSNCEEHTSPNSNKRVLRSSLMTSSSPTPENNEEVQSNFEEESPEQIVFVEPSVNAGHSIPPIALTGLQPPQHSAKKRWLRQAISEESDSPTAESPPNEMITPLKKRRLARESLSSDHLAHLAVDDSSVNLTKPFIEIGVDNTTADNQISNMMSPNLHLIKSANKVESATHIDIALCKKDDDEDSTGNVYHRYNCTDDLLNIDIKSASKDSKRKLNLDIERIIGVPPKFEDPPDCEVKDIKGEQEALDSKIDCDSKSDFLQSPIEYKRMTSKRESEESPKKQEIVNFEVFKDNLPDVSVKSINEGLSEKSEPISNINSTETSGNSSPLVDEMDDIQKKIHSFHTENIQILKIRNKKQPKEKRKKVNLNFDLCVLADQTVSVKLRSEMENSPEIVATEINGDVECDSVKSGMSEIPIADNSVTSIEQAAVPDVETLLTHSDPTLPETTIASPASEKTKLPEEPHPVVDTESLDVAPATPAEGKSANSITTSHHLFSALFDGEKVFSSSANDIPNMHILKNAIDRTANMDSSLFEKSSISSVNEYKNVQEILTRVNKIDLSNSLLLSGVLRDAECTASLNPQKSPTPTKLFAPRSNDPRLNPPPVSKPKPARRKLSISEYRKRHNMCTASDGARSGSDSNGSSSSAGNCASSAATAACSGSAPSPLRLEDDDFDSRLEKQLEDSMTEQSSLNAAESPADQRGVFNAQPTQVEKQRENLSERLRREFGLSLPEDEEARPATVLQGSWSASDNLNISTAIQMHLPAAMTEHPPEAIGLSRAADGDPTGAVTPKFPRMDR